MIAADVVNVPPAAPGWLVLLLVLIVVAGPGAIALMRAAERSDDQRADDESVRRFADQRKALR